MKQLVRKAKIIGTGSYVPEKVYTNEYLQTIANTDPKWIEQNLGIKERRISADNECTSDLATQAGLRAIEDSGFSVEDIDLIIVATSTPDRLAPSTAAIVQYKTEAINAVAFDISAVIFRLLRTIEISILGKFSINDFRILNDKPVESFPPRVIITELTFWFIFLGCTSQKSLRRKAYS